MKHRAQAIEIKWDQPEAFALVTETTTDGERIARQKAQQQKDRQEAEQRQTTLI